MRRSGPRAKEELEILIDEIKDHVRSLLPRIESITHLIQKDRQSGRLSQTEIQVRLNQFNQLKRRFHDVYNTFNNSQDDYRRRLSRRVKRQLEVVGENLSVQEVDEMLESRSESIFYDRVHLYEQSGLAVLREVTNRHDEILKLEQSIRELHDLYLELEMMIRSQGELVDRIDLNVERAHVNVEGGRKNFERAVTYNKQAKRKTCILVIVGVAVLVACLVIVLLLTLGK
ncbi:Syntaxin-like isoform X4 [Aphelenchoides fujianensis]|nr:Syntaxin-like isoform X4 [Aphelenchoides fujianensis]